MSTDEIDDAQEEIISGPYCMHWYEPGECPEQCLCGHSCNAHAANADCGDCECIAFTMNEDAP